MNWDDVVRSMARDRSLWGPHSLHTAEATGSKPVTPTSQNASQPSSNGPLARRIARRSRRGHGRSLPGVARPSRERSQSTVGPWCRRGRVRLALLEDPMLDGGWSPHSPVTEDGHINLDPPHNRAIARDLAGRSIILLDNHSGLLPLAETVRSIAVVGPCANDHRRRRGRRSSRPLRSRNVRRGLRRRGPRSAGRPGRAGRGAA